MPDFLCDTCGHPLVNHYDGVYCMDDCPCGCCEECGEQFVEQPVNNGICDTCKFYPALTALLGDTDA